MAPLAFVSVISLSLWSLTSASRLWLRQTDPVTTGTCANLHHRKAWHNLTDEEKAAYIEAELCLMRSPPKIGHPLAQNRWDEFSIAHEIQTRKPKTPFAFSHVGGKNTEEERESSLLLWKTLGIR